MNHNRRKILTEQENEIPDFHNGINFFARVLSCRSGDIFEVEYLPAESDVTSTTNENELIQTMVRLPSKFKHVIWAKNGDIVILSREDFDFNSRCQYNISSILAQHHLKHFIQQKTLPHIFIPEKFKYKSYANYGTDSTDNGINVVDDDNDNDDDDGDDNEDQDEDDDILPTIDNYRKIPFAEEESSDDDSD
jgi:translation initiation factor IF-1